jgi:hypothetical protein
VTTDGHKFRIQAKGSEQKVRGIKWGGKRPDLIVCDDLENDEIVMNPERRAKFARWFMNALIPCGSDTCSIRVVGTILHLDSMLQRILDDPTWKHLFYQAEDGNFENILWPEQYSAERLKGIYRGYKAQGDTEGYAQEYRNTPRATRRNTETLPLPSKTLSSTPTTSLISTVMRGDRKASRTSNIMLLRILPLMRKQDQTQR